MPDMRPHMRALLLAAVAATASCLATAAAVPQPLDARVEAPAPAPRTNWALAAAADANGTAIFAFYGMGPDKHREAITREVRAYDPAARRWRALPPLPVAQGRLASAAVRIGGAIYVVGGYTVAANASERSTAQVLRFDPRSGSARAVAHMPVPVDDSVALAWRDRWLVLVSGWHDDGNVRDVQFYDTRTRRWRLGTPWPGEPVFGHAGGLVGDTLVVCDGVTATLAARGRHRYALTDACWRGTLDPAHPGTIAWQTLPPHPGVPLYRAAATGTTLGGARVLFAGGSTRAYNYDGLGYDGLPAPAAAGVFAYDVAARRWTACAPLPVASMDHRALVEAGGRFFLLGGMRDPQRVSAEGLSFAPPRCTAAP